MFPPELGAKQSQQVEELRSLRVSPAKEVMKKTKKVKIRDCGPLQSSVWLDAGSGSEDSLVVVPHKRKKYKLASEGEV